MQKDEILIQDIFNCADSESLLKADFHGELASYINELILNHFDKLVSLLYRVDVSEAKLKNLLKQHDKSDAGELIASMIIERQLQKLKSREAHSKSGNCNDDTESW